MLHTDQSRRAEYQAAARSGDSVADWPVQQIQGDSVYLQFTSGSNQTYNEGGGTGTVVQDLELLVSSDNETDDTVPSEGFRKLPKNLNEGNQLLGSAAAHTHCKIN